MAVGVVSESAELDFKSSLGSNEELAKDVAAMTVDSGVIVIGIAETNGLASSITPIALTGAAERIQQVVDSRIRPAPPVELEVLRQAPTDTEGLIVIEVSASRFAPHYTNENPSALGTRDRLHERA